MPIKLNDDESQSVKGKKNICSVCEKLGAPPPCRGHAKGGGGGSGDSGKGDDTAKNDGDNLGQQNSNFLNYEPSNVQNDESDLTIAMEWAQFLKSNINPIQFEQASVDIQCDNLHGILTFQLKPGLSPEDMKIAKEFLLKIKEEFELFKSALQEKNISVSQLKLTMKDGNLTIKIPNPKYFSEFIQRLAEKNLLPSVKNINPINEEFIDKHARKLPSPFDITMKPRFKFQE